MKTIRLLLTGLIFFCGSGFEVIENPVIREGNTFSAFGKYTIMMCDSCEKFTSDIDCSYIIQFENSRIHTKVCIWKENGVKKYAILSDDLSLQYSYNKVYLGVERLSKDFIKYGYCTNDSCLNRYQYFHQKILARGERSDIDNVALIASYYPHLILKGMDTFLAN